MSKYFTEIFKKLVPAGHGVLVMKKGESEQEVGSNNLLFFSGLKEWMLSCT